ncbi:MAG: hypothetical protein IK064_02535 [Clostridia bacterium]|nr:hypothetical protein [Clostridia bacterium]MBR6006484.1 hypothetical protein [Clostridia bacterium]
MYKRILAAILAAAALVIAAAACSPAGNGENTVIEIRSSHDAHIVTLPPETGGEQSFDPLHTPAQQTEAPPFTAVPPTPTPTPVPTPTPAPQTGTPTSRPTSSSQTNPPHPVYYPGMAPDYTVFDTCAFVGNSTFEGLHQYGIITHGKFFTRVGLNVLSVYTQTTSTGHVPIIDELNTGHYDAVILMFGENELGWPDLNVFISKYAQLMRDVWRRQPNCKIFIMGIPPVSERVSNTSTTGVTNENIYRYNAQLQDLALRTANAYYVSVPEQLMNDNGALPDEASSDGIHLNKTYSRYWADHICLTVMSVLWS